jgi:anaerobic C4-dicarboxylate transporter DcuA
MFWLEFAVVLAAIFIGARVGGIALGTVAAFGLAILIFGFGNAPGALPVDVIFIIISVITAAATLEAAGGLDLMVLVAEKIIRSRPTAITFVAPIVSYFFTFFAGTGHVAYSLLPVIAEVSRKAGVRPERPMSISVIASQQAITASPISAATAGMIALLAGANSQLGLIDILVICLPATLIGCLIGALSVYHMGVELADDPVYQERLSKGLIKDEKNGGPERPEADRYARVAILIFFLAVLGVVLLGIFPALRPTFLTNGKEMKLGMAPAIQIVMLGCSALIMIVCKRSSDDVISTPVMRAGAVAVISILGIAWLGSTFFEAFQDEVVAGISHQITARPWIFSVGLFALSILLYSQAATVAALMHVGVSLAIPLPFLIAMFPAVNGYFFLPTYGTIVAAISFDQTGTTKIGRYILNHSFMRPGLVATFSAVVIGLCIAKVFY